MYTCGASLHELRVYSRLKDRVPPGISIHIRPRPNYNETGGVPTSGVQSLGPPLFGVWVWKMNIIMLIVMKTTIVF